MKVNKTIEVKKVILLSTIINIFQISIIILIIAYNIFFTNNTAFKMGSFTGNLILYIILLIIGLNGAITIKTLYSMVFSKGERQGLIESIEHLTQLNKILRAQRHDFVNHLQVVYNLLELQEYDEGRDYIEKIYRDVIQVNKALKTSNAAVNALLQAKKIYAEKNNIKVNLFIHTDLKEISIASWEFCRVLSNIIDNAIYELTSCEEKNKVLTIELYEKEKTYNFSIRNNGPRIEKDKVNTIFEPGYTTKKEEGQGMGLAIVREIIAAYKGEITVKSNDIETIFQGAVPKS